MYFTTTVLVLVCSVAPLLLVSVSAGPPVPPRTLGYTYRTSNASRAELVTLTAYVGVTCKDSRAAFPTLIEVADQLSGQNFELVVRSFPLPYHRNNHLITEALHLIAQHTDSEGVFPFLEDIYDDMDSLTTKGTKEMTDSQVLDAVEKIATNKSCISSATFNNEVHNYDKPARLDFKYGCTRGVYGTPTFMVNDVVVDATRSWTTEQWLELINPLL